MRILPPKRANSPLTEVSVENNGNGELFSVHRYVQRDLEDQIREEKMIKTIWAKTDIKTYTIRYSRPIPLYTRGKSYHVYDDASHGYLIEDDTGQKARASKYFFSRKPIDMSDNEVETRVSQVLELLNKGYTRYKKDPRNVVGSIQEHFQIKPAEVARIFKHPKLRGKKVKSVGIKLVDDISANGDTKTNEADKAKEIDQIFS